MPADKQGIKVGDVIKNVDDFEVTEYKHAVRLIGKDQEVAKFIIERDGKEISMDFVRSSDDSEMIGITSKNYRDTLYVKIDSVSCEMLKPFEQAISENSFNSIIIDLRGNSVRYTEGYYNVGDWENYHGKGIKPDVVIDMDSDYIGTDKDIQLEKTLELVK